MPVDYSKWDKLQYSDEEGDDQSDRDGSLVDSEDEEPVKRPSVSSSVPFAEDSGVGRRPVVTRLDHPSSISIGPSGIEVQHPPKATASPFLAAPPLVVATSPSDVEHAPLTLQTAPRAEGQAENVSEDADDLEDDLLVSKLTRNGQNCDRYFWSQTREMATFVVVLPSLNVRGGNIHNFSIISTGSSDVASDGAARVSFAVSAPDTGLVEPFSFSLRYPIKTDEDTVDGCWQLHTLATKGMRLLVVELHKDPIGHQLYLWWDRACVGESPIDTTKLEDRSKEKMAPSNVQQVWDEAHEEFRRRNKDRALRSVGQNEDN
jgi:hypothetical protein